MLYTISNIKENELVYTFLKLKSKENYNKYTRDMGFAFLDISLMTFAKSTLIKPKLYTKDIKHPKDGSAPLTKERIEKQEAKVEK